MCQWYTMTVWIMDRMGDGPILSIIHTVTIDTMLNNNGCHNRYRVNIVRCKHGLSSSDTPARQPDQDIMKKLRFSFQWKSSARTRFEIQTCNDLLGAYRRWPLTFCLALLQLSSCAMISMILGSASSVAGTFRKARRVRLAITSIPRRANSLHAYTIYNNKY